ncbi:MAG: hypothetical protein ACFNMD_05185 [Prevotella sp.]
MGAKIAQLRGISNTIQAIVCNADAIISVPFTLWGGITAAATRAYHSRLKTCTTAAIHSCGDRRKIMCRRQGERLCVAMVEN